MKDVRKIAERYSYLFYPANNKWLHCTHDWNATECSCIDEFELELVFLLGAASSGAVFRFTNVPKAVSEQYKMLVNSSDFSVKQLGYPLCKDSKDCYLYHEKARMENAKGEFFWNGELQWHELNRDPYTLYVSMFLYAVNCDTLKRRSDIILFSFEKKPRLFVKYIESLENFLKHLPKTYKKLDSSFLEYHLKLIRMVLEAHVKRNSNLHFERSKIINTVLDQEYFEKNYKKETDPIGFKKKLKASLLKNASWISSDKIGHLPFVSIESNRPVIDVIKSIVNGLTRHSLNPKKIENGEVIAINIMGIHDCLQQIMIREWQDLHPNDKNIAKKMAALKDDCKKACQFINPER